MAMTENRYHWPEEAEWHQFRFSGKNQQNPSMPENHLQQGTFENTEPPEERQYLFFFPFLSVTNLKPIEQASKSTSELHKNSPLPASLQLYHSLGKLKDKNKKKHSRFQL